MAKPFDSISPQLRDFIQNQRLFFVATAPLDPAGHINLSPKGLDTFRILDPRRVAYLDLTGSGNETSAHVDQNGRITFMFCSLDGQPKIVRLYGRGRVVLPGSEEFASLIQHFTPLAGVRQIIVADIERGATSCGFGVPRFSFVEQRDDLPQYHERKGPGALQQYQRDKNARSIDGLLTPIGKRQDPSV